MNIALITEKFPPDPGGLAVSVARIAGLLVSAGHMVRVFVPTEEPSPLSLLETEQAGVILHRFGSHRRVEDTMADWFDHIVARHRIEPFDVLHGYFLTRAGFMAAYAGRYLEVPSVVSARGNDLDRAVFDSAKAGHILYALQRANAITANTRDLQQKASALTGRNVHLVPNGIDTDLFTRRERHERLAAQAGLPNLPVVLFAGEARAKKGLAPLLVAARNAARRIPFCTLLIGGIRNGDDADLVRIFQKQNPELPLRIIPPASFETMPGWYSIADVVAVPSLRDGLPNALLEAMACERAIVASDTGGIRDAVTDRVNGILVQPGNADDLASALLCLLENPELRNRLGAAARETVVQNFTCRQELDLNLHIYKSLS